MTRRKSNPQKRGRKDLTRGVREMVYLRFRSYWREQKGAKTLRDIGSEFVSTHQAWFAEIGIAIGNYESFRNVRAAGRKERAERRRKNWGIITNITGRKFLSANAEYIRHVQRGGRGLA